MLKVMSTGHTDIFDVFRIAQNVSGTRQVGIVWLGILHLCIGSIELQDVFRQHCSCSRGILGQIEIHALSQQTPAQEWLCQWFLHVILEEHSEPGRDTINGNAAHCDRFCRSFNFKACHQQLGVFWGFNTHARNFPLADKLTMRVQPITLVC